MSQVRAVTYVFGPDTGWVAEGEQLETNLLQRSHPGSLGGREVGITNRASLARPVTI